MRNCQRRGVGSVPTPCMLLLIAMGAPALGQGATRDLSDFTEAGVTFTVTISIIEPPNAILLGVEDAPPFGWVASNISDTGTWDPGTRKVKWLFFDPPFPSVLTYDLAPPAGDIGSKCFSGTVSFDVAEDPILGDECINVGIPTVSQWGLTAMSLLLLSAGTLTVRRVAPVSNR